MMDHWRELFPGRIIELDYDELVTDPEPQICQLISALGLSWNDKCLDVQSNTRAVKTLSVFQAGQPISAASVTGWVKYRDDLAELLDELTIRGVKYE